MNSSPPAYFRHRFPAEIMSHCVWLCFRFFLGFPDVEQMMAKRVVTVTYESVREWRLKFGRAYAKRIRSRVPVTAGVFLRVHRASCSNCGAVDQDGEVLDIRVQPRRDKRAAKRFFRKPLKGLRYVPHAIITDKLGSYAAAKKQLLPSVEHCRDRWRNNRAENSHQPTRERERRMRDFKSPGQAQRFLSVFGVIASLFRLGRHLLAAVNHREIMRRCFAQWREFACLQPAI